jgi:hypothetical protein
MEPVDSIGEWIGLLGGLLVIASVSLGVALISLGPISPSAGKIAHGITQVPPVIDAVACGLDPTDPCNWSLVVVRNDTRSSITLAPCEHHGGRDDRCGSPILVLPGRTSPTDQYAGVRAETGLRTWIAVTSRGQRLGCLVLDGHSKKRDGDLVLASQAQPCGHSSSPTTKPVGRIHV